MKIIILGSGTGVPSLRRNAPGYYLEARGLEILIDCGSGTLRQLEKSRKSYKYIDAVFITHTHPDHTSDLIALIHALRSTPNFSREKDLIICGNGIKKFYEKCIAPCTGKVKMFSIELIEIEDKFELGNMRIFTTRTVHTLNSAAYRFEDDGKSVVITGDCDYSEEIIKISKGADLLIIDCSFPDTRKVSGHLTPNECGRIANKAGVKKLLLSHIYPGDYEDFLLLNECKAVFNRDVSLAEDLMEIDMI